MIPCLAAFGDLAVAATYHADPETGSMSNPGTAEAPWSSLEAVFAAGKTFEAGDIILLRSGYHGLPEVKGRNSAAAFIQPEAGALPKIRKLTVKDASDWVISGLDISPENTTPVAYGITLVDIQNSCTRITISGCQMRAAADTSGWDVADWQDNAGHGISSKAPYTVLRNNTIHNVGFGMTISKTATHTLAASNTIKGFSMDAIRCLADFSTFEYNTVTDSYVSDSNHDDFFQSYSTDASGSVGRGTVYNVTLRGNIFISSTVDHPLKKPPQGIGLFDGMFENWVIENNIISSRTYHGIALYGAINCRIANNTVVENPVSGSSNNKPWVKIYEHKNQSDGSPWPVRSSGNLIRNNISSAKADMPFTAGTMDHNVTVTDYPACFTNYGEFDFSLLPQSPAVGAGNAEGAPPLDLLGRTRQVPFEAGAYELLADTIGDSILTGAVRGPGGFSITWDSRIGPVDVERSTSLGESSWKTVSKNDADGKHTDATAPESGPVFYRLRKEER